MIKFKAGISQAGISALLIPPLTNLAKNLKFDIIITSAFRTPEENEAIGGNPNSSHLRGLACDIRTTSDADRYELILKAVESGFTRIGIAKDHLHIDIDPEKNQKRIWVE